MSTLRERAIKLCTRFFLVTTTFYWPVVGSQMIADSIGRDLYTVLLPMYPISLAIIAVMYYKNDWFEQGAVDMIKEDVKLGYVIFFLPHIGLVLLCKGYFEPDVSGWIVFFNFFMLHFFNSSPLLASEIHCHYDYSKGWILGVMMVMILSSFLHKSYIQNTPHFIAQLFATVSAGYAAVKVNTIYHDGLTVVHPSLTNSEAASQQ